MDFVCEHRPSDSPLIERFWRTNSREAGTFISQAAVQWEMVATRYQGRTSLTVRGLESQASLTAIPEDP
jgi:hypothetical protein